MVNALDIYCIAIGGTGMAPLACLLEQLGHRVRGSDGPLYPPMSTLLASSGIVPNVGFDPAHLEPAPDLVIVGNAVPRTNVEAEAVEARGLPRISMPQAIARFLLEGRKPLVVSGTHGKTTTTTLAAWVYDQCGQDPGYLIGGVPMGIGASFRSGSGSRFVIEGDEYNAAYFDREAKFLHYRPQTVILTSAEHDHVDLYPVHEMLLDAFRRLVGLVPSGGVVIACGDDADVRRVLGGARAPVVTYGLGAGNRVKPDGPVESTPAGSRFRMRDEKGGSVWVDLGLSGEHNVMNALAVWAAAQHDGLPAAAVAGALSSFAGVKRRLEILGTTDGITIVDDFAHHPTAIAATLEGLAARFAGRRRVAVFEPRSLTAGRAFFEDAYVEALAAAHLVFLAPIFHYRRLGDARLDRAAVVRRLEARGVGAHALDEDTDLLETIGSVLLPGDVVVTMSSGAFDGLPRRLLDNLVTAAAQRP